MQTMLMSAACVQCSCSKGDWSNRSHDFTRLSPCRCGRPAVFPSRQHRRAKAEALKGAEQVEAVILGLGFRMNDLRQLVGERHFPSNRPQVVSIHGVLDYGERKKKRKTESIKEWWDLNLNLNIYINNRTHQEGKQNTRYFVHTTEATTLETVISLYPDLQVFKSVDLNCIQLHRKLTFLVIINYKSGSLDKGSGLHVGMDSMWVEWSSVSWDTLNDQVDLNGTKLSRDLCW